MICMNDVVSVLRIPEQLLCDNIKDRGAEQQRTNGIICYPVVLAVYPYNLVPPRSFVDNTRGYIEEKQIL